MNPTATATNTDAIRQALLARANAPSMGQQPTPPALNQTPVTGAPAVATPAKPQPNYSSPFSGPTPAPTGLDDETRKLVKSLTAKLLAVL
jgi:hypothetical protein